MSQLAGKRAFASTLATGLWTQLLTVVTGALTARLLGPEGRGQLAGAQVWPGILGMIALFGLNNALSLRAARNPELKWSYERQALRLGLVLSVVVAGAGWFAMPFLVPGNNLELLWLSRLALLHVPLFVLTSNLMAIDQGVGDFRTFNLARSILTPVYLVLLVALWLTNVRQLAWFTGALLAANFAVLAYRLTAVRRRNSSANAEVRPAVGLFRTGLPFWITGVAGALRENAERLLLLFLLGPSTLGLYVVAFTASGVHLNVSRSLNLIVFSRGAALQPKDAFLDAARFFRLMGLINLALGLCIAAGMPILVRVIYGGHFSGSIVPAMLLVVAQYFLSQAAILDEALRARGNPVIGLGGLLAGIIVFGAVAGAMAGQFGLIGVVWASIFGQIAYWTWMIVAFQRASGGLPLMPGRADCAELGRLYSETRHSLAKRFPANSSI